MSTSTAAEAKANGKTVKVTTGKPATTEKAQPKIVQGNVWQLCRDLMQDGKKDEEIKKAAETWLTKNTDSKTALQFFAKRISYRALRRAKISLATAAKTEKKASKKKEA